MIRGGWSRWVAFCAQSESATSIAALRVAFALCVLLSVGSVWASDLVDVIWVDRAYGGLRNVSANWLVSALGGATPAVVHRLVYVTLASAVCLALGVGGRAMALLTLHLCLALFDLNGQAGGSYDELLLNALWLLVLAPCSHTLSVDCRLRTGSWSTATPIAAGWRYLFVLQLVLVYWSTGVQKVSSHWVPGGDFSALYFILQQPTWHRFDMQWLAWVYPLTQLGTAVSWLWEVSAPVWWVAFVASLHPDALGRVGAWLRRWRVRLVWGLVGVVFHVTVYFLMDVGPFSPISLAYYFALIHPWELDAFARRARLRQ